MTTIVTRAGKGSALTHTELDTNFTNLNTAKLEAADITGKADTGHTHALTAGASDVTITAANLNALDDGTNTALHFHDSDRSRSNHTGTQAASTISDFSTAADARIAAASVNALADVVVTTPSTGQVLKFDGTNWINDTDAGGGGSITVQDEGTPLTTGATTLNFTGAGVTATGTGATKTIDIPGAGTATITVKENGTNVSTAITALDFLGADFDVTESPAGEANVVVAAAIARLASPTFTGTPAAPTASNGTNTTQLATTAFVQSQVAASSQPLDSDLTAIAALTPTNDDIVQRKAGAWTNRTMAQLNTDLLAVAPTVVVESTTARTLAASDNGKIIYCTSASATTITVGTAFNGLTCTIVRGGTGTVTITASSTTLNGGSLVLNGQYLAVTILPDGTANEFVIVGASGPVHGVETAIASATTTDIGASATFQVSITGTTTITGLGTVSAGTQRWGRFTGALTLTHNATSLILPNNGSNITTAAGDRFMATSLGSGNWVVNFYTKADGTALVGGGGGVTDGDKGDITISASGATYTIDAGVVTLAKMANLAQDQVIGRVTASTGVPETFTVTAAARTVLDDTTVGAMLTTLGGQPLDATLTALAGLTIAANSLSIGTGADAFSQTTFAANTFPARASTGNLVAKTITDFGLSLVDDTDAAGGRATLVAATTAQTFQFTFNVATVANGDVIVIPMEAFTGTVTKVTTDCDSGTCTLTGKVNTTAFGGTANSVSTTKTSQTHSSANTWAIGDDLVFTASSNSACLGMRVTVTYTRTLA